MHLHLASHTAPAPPDAVGYLLTEEGQAVVEAGGNENKLPPQLLAAALESWARCGSWPAAVLR